MTSLLDSAQEQVKKNMLEKIHSREKCQILDDLLGSADTPRIKLRSIWNGLFNKKFFKGEVTFF